MIYINNFFNVLEKFIIDVCKTVILKSITNLWKSEVSLISKMYPFSGKMSTCSES